MFVLRASPEPIACLSRSRSNLVGQSGKLVVVGELADLRFPSRKLGQFPLQQRIALRQALDALEGGMCLLPTECERAHDICQFGKRPPQVRSLNARGFRVGPLGTQDAMGILRTALQSILHDRRRRD